MISWLNLIIHIQGPLHWKIVMFFVSMLLWRQEFATLTIHDHYHIRFNIFFPYLCGLGGLLKICQAFLPLVRFLLNLFSLRLLMITWSHVSLGLPQGEKPLNLKVLHLQDQVFFPFFPDDQPIIVFCLVHIPSYYSVFV